MDNMNVSPILALQRQRALLQMEYNADKEAYRRQTEAKGLARQVKRGDAWFPIRMGRSYYNSLNQFVVEVFRTDDSGIEHNFEPGRPVVFFSVDGGKTDGKTKEKLSILNSSLTVSYVDGDRMVVAVPDTAVVAGLQGRDRVGVMLSFDETSYRTMFDALDRTMRAKGRQGYLRDLFFAPHPKAETFTFAPMRFPYLNNAQELAVNNVLRAKDVAIVHGPPGTGKTTTLVEAINETLKRETQVLVCAQSNMAVDWISEKLVDRGVNVLRLGNPTRVNDKMLSFSFERRFEAHADYPQLWSIRKAIRELRARRKRGDDRWHQKMESLKGRATELELRIQAELFGEARVIACTLVGSANRLLDGRKFGTVFIDEAAQALEAACWIPLRRVSKVVLAGDHCQLPPTVKSIEALRAGLGHTMMERLVERMPEAVTLLTTQYRMNEDIMRFSSDWFYRGEVVADASVKHRGILDYDSPIEWVDTSAQVVEGDGEQPMSFKEEFVGETFGRINKAEAELTLRLLERYFTKIGKQRVIDERIDVGVVSPYRAQVQYLRSLLMKNGFFKPYRKFISINTVDGFQGQERDVMLISLVRSNADGEIGFLRDLRRMNVAITRARMKLIILGNVQTMTKHPFYKQLWNYINRDNDNRNLHG